jgi:hypothetical protein
MQYAAYMAGHGESSMVFAFDEIRALVLSPAAALGLDIAAYVESGVINIQQHDHLAQRLVLVRLKLGQAKQGPVSRSADMIKQAEEVVSDALTYTRNLVAELSPPVLHEFGLLAALRWLAEQMQPYSLHVTVRSTPKMYGYPRIRRCSSSSRFENC